MSVYLHAPLVPRNGYKLVVGIVARISGCSTQSELSLDDQVDHGKQVVSELYQEPVDYHIISTTGKGESLDRPELAEIERMLRTRSFDLLVCEDIGRLIRGTEAVRLCGIAVDHGTRVIATNDCIDTSEDTWEEDVISACRDHVGHNAHTSKRLKHKLMNRFLKFGGAVALEIYGYIKPPGAKTYEDWQKDPAATPFIQEGFRRLRTTLNCSAVADWFNEENVPTGKYRRRKKWNGAMIRKFYQNSILKGMPGRGFRRTIKHHETGRRVSVINPKGPVFRECPHLAHLDPVDFDEVNALLKAKNSYFRHKPVSGTDPLWQVPRKRTRFPGQHVHCWYCGQRYVWGGNGITENLMCANAREWHCWNAIGFNGSLMASKLVEAITAELYNLDGFDTQFSELVKMANQDCSRNRSDRYQQLQRNEESLAHEKDNFIAAIAQFGPRPILQKKILELEDRDKKLARERHQLESGQNRKLQLPQSVGELRLLLEKQFRCLAVDSPEFGDLMRQLVPDIHVYLVRLCDGGHLLPRAKVKLTLAGIVPDVQHTPEVGHLLTRERTLDLFEPPQRERIREEAVRLTAEGLSQRQAADLLAEKPTQPAVEHAIALDRKMRAMGLESPYVIVSEPPEDYGKLRRHKNQKYRFEPLKDYRQPVL